MASDADQADGKAEERQPYPPNPRFLPRIFFMSFMLFMVTAHAQRTWDGTTGNWNDPTNWTGDTAPIFGEETIINNGGTALLPFTVSGSYGWLLIGATSGGSGAINLTGGVLQGVDARLGFAANSTGSATVTSGTWVATSFASSFVVGDDGTGSLLVNGGLVISENSEIGVSGTGSVTVTSGTWATSNGLSVGWGGTGSLLVNGGFVSSLSSSIGGQSWGAGSATVTSGTWANSFTLNVGSSGTGSLTIEGGSVSNADGFIGYNSTGNGSVTVTGEGSTWINSGSLTVGREGSNNILTIANGALVKVGDAAGETISFSTLGGSNNFLRLEGGFLALYDDQKEYVEELIGAGYIQLWDGSEWVGVTLQDIQITFYTGDPIGAAAALAATGYSGLGGYTVASVVPEPGTCALVGLGLASLLLRRRRKKVLP